MANTRRRTSPASPPWASTSSFPPTSGTILSSCAGMDSIASTSTSTSSAPAPSPVCSSHRRSNISRMSGPSSRVGWLLATAATVVVLGLGHLPEASAQSTTAAPAGSATTALNEPSGTQVLFGAWVETDWGDTPLAFNERLGHNASVLQIAQDIPLLPYNWDTGAGGAAPEELIERSTTDAAVFLTVYPANGFGTVTVDDYTLLGNQILNWTQNYTRSVFLRYAPEMNGNWNVYGLQPLAYVQNWQIMYNTIKAIVPQVAMVWAPNTGQGYPYSMPLPSNQTEAAAIDTNGDGQLTNADSPFTPYYPGDDFVDWIGLSVYYKGPNSQNINQDQQAGYCYGALNNINPSDGTQTVTPWYETYCNKPGKACMFSESGAAYHDMIFGDQGVSNFDLKQAWYEDCLTNATFFQEFPRMKLMMQFEYRKNETDSGVEDSRDYRLTNATDVLSGFQSALSTMGGYYSWANYKAIPTSTPNIVSSVFTTTNSLGQTITTTGVFTTSTFSFVTVRNTQTGFPSLFGNFASSATRAVVLSVAAFGTTASVILGGAIFLMRA